MATKVINQEGIGCDAEGCDKFFLGAKPNSWRKVQTMKPNGDPSSEYDACSVKHAKLIAAEFVTITK